MSIVPMGRVVDELILAGVSRVNRHKTIIGEITKLLDEDEHIGGVVYGKYQGGTGLGWIVATNKRVLIIDKKPLFNASEELSYDVISGVKIAKAGLFGTLTLHTRVGDYLIRVISSKCAKIFVKYIDRRRLENLG